MQCSSSRSSSWLLMTSPSSNSLPNALIRISRRASGLNFPANASGSVSTANRLPPKCSATNASYSFLGFGTPLTVYSVVLPLSLRSASPRRRSNTSLYVRRRVKGLPLSGRKLPSTEQSSPSAPMGLTVNALSDLPALSLPVSSQKYASARVVFPVPLSPYTVAQRPPGEKVNCWTPLKFSSCSSSSFTVVLHRPFRDGIIPQLLCGNHFKVFFRTGRGDLAA